jgi:sterol desaturase/sphingolipid hydroxylase (fatty acid hydroxylase superfamily)
MKPEIIFIFAIYFGFGLLEFIRSDLFKKPTQKRGDGIVEFVSAISLLGITQPLVLFLSYLLMGRVFPDIENQWAGINVFLGFGLLVVFDDMMQYWWHRASHTFAWLYKLHRPHHNGEYMSVRLVYRNNIFYYFLLPGLWFSGALIYLGLGHIYAVYIVLKLSIIIAAHSDLAWDRPLYKIKWMSPVMWIVERTISTPSTHHAHHGKHKSDGVTNYKGNFGNMLFLWDVVFGTAKITRQYPPEFGVENLPETSVGEQLIWPLIKAPKT